MNKPSTRPAPVERYLERIRRGLADLPAAYRDEVLAGLAEHADDRLADGDQPDTVLASLGDADTVIAQAIEQHEAQDGEHPVRWLTPRRVAQFVALALATLTSLFVIFFIPAFQESTTTTVTEVSGSGVSPTPIESSITESGAVSIYEWVGPLALIGASVPILLTGVPLFVRGRAGRLVAIACTAAFVVFAVIASATIGWFYLPALASAIVATVLPDRRR